MRFTKLTLLAVSVALAACGGEPPPQDNGAPAVFDPIIDENETGIGEKPADEPQACATATATMTGDVWLSGLDHVAALDNDGVAVVEGDLHVGDVDSLAGLDCLRQVTGDVIISGTESLKDTDGLGRLGTIGGSLWITENAQLASLRGFGALKRVGGDIVVERNVSLTSLAGITDIGRGLRGGIYIRDNDALETVTGFNRLEAMGGDFVVAGNAVLDHVEGFYDGSVTTLSYGNIIVEDNPMLGWAELPGMGLDGSANSLWLSGNARLKDVRLHGDTKFRVTGDVVISTNDALEQLHGFDRINAITGDFIVEGNQELDTLVGFAGLKGVMGSVEIVANRSLENVELLRLEEVYGDMLVARNDSLTSLTGLRSLMQVNGDVTLFANPELDTCFEASLETRLDTGRGDLDGRCSNR